MAKTTAPLLSIGASGTVAKTLVSSSWKGRKYTRIHVVPSNPQSSEQTKTRSLFAWLQGVWKLAPTDFTDVWDLFAKGQVLTGRNAFTSPNVKAMRGETDPDLMVFSNGAKGGPAPTAVSAVAGGSSGEIDVTITAPATPTGWTLVSLVAACILSVNPQTDDAQVIVVNSAASGTVTVSGLTASGNYVVGGWIKWQKPDGTTAYGASLATTATAAA